MKTSKLGCHLHTQLPDYLLRRQQDHGRISSNMTFSAALWFQYFPSGSYCEEIDEARLRNDKKSTQHVILITSYPSQDGHLSVPKPPVQSLQPEPWLPNSLRHTYTLSSISSHDSYDYVTFAVYTRAAFVLSSTYLLTSVIWSFEAKFVETHLYFISLPSGPASRGSDLRLNHLGFPVPATLFSSLMLSSFFRSSSAFTFK